MPWGEDCGGDGFAGAAPVVVPGSVLGFGVTSRMPGGACGAAGWLCAMDFGGAVCASCTLVLFRP